MIFAVNLLLFTLLSSRYTTKPLLIAVLIVSSLTAYFMNSYHVVIDADMIRNVIQTNLRESADLLTLKQVLYLLFLGFLPAYLVYKAPVRYRGLKKEVAAKVKIILLSLLLIGGSLFLFSKHYTSFFREHKPLRYNVNPTYWIYSIGKYIDTTFNSGKTTLRAIGTDAAVTEDANSSRKLVIMVVGEAARADHFSLNGYSRETNPMLKKEHVIDFTHLSSCGTSTAESVPCMFSIFNRDNYSYKKGISTENVLDILKHTGKVALLWRDNNSDSKGVAVRIPYQDFKTPENNPVCDHGECRDEGMLAGLDRFIKKHQDKDILIILHQMGNHGPAYYKRYPKSFEKFRPVCKTSQLEQCTQQEITNAYDNALLYTDYFLSKTIDFLKRYDNTRQTAMLYISDHGESLGENGVYLHGLPYFMAPDAQTHVGALLWLGEKMRRKLNVQKLMKESDKSYSQDNLFHTLLGFFGVKTKVYKREMDIIAR